MSEEEVENGEEQIDESGRNLTQQRLDEDAAERNDTEEVARDE